MIQMLRTKIKLRNRMPRKRLLREKMERKRGKLLKEKQKGRLLKERMKVIKQKQLKKEQLNMEKREIFHRRKKLNQKEKAAVLVSVANLNKKKPRSHSLILKRRTWV